MIHASLFSGIGGFDLAAEWMGWENLFHCEWNPFGQKVLKHHFPNSISYNDITKTDFSIHRGQVDILTGGFPCQPYSAAGKRLGTEDERHLWPEMLRTIQEVQPRWVVGENVLGLTNWNGGLVFQEVQTDLEAKGYEVQAYVLPACSKNAPHRRDRVWFVAHSNLYGQQQEWGYDRSSKNVNGSNNEKFRSTNSKDFNGCDTYGNFERESEIDNRTFKEGIYKEDTTSNTRRIHTMDKDNRESKGSSKDSQFENNQSRTLVQNGQSRIQLPINRGLDKIKGKLSSSSLVRSENDLSRNKRMEGNVTNTNKIRFSTKMENGELARKLRFAKCDKRDLWDSFPTQSPICGGDDGISIELDSISLSKYRKESLMAYGNAIVPQVAFEIFKAIEKFELMVNK